MHWAWGMVLTAPIFFPGTKVSKDLSDCTHLLSGLKAGSAQQDKYWPGQA